MDSLSHHAQNDKPQTATIPLSQGFVALVDAEDADLAQFRWHYAKGYARQQRKRGDTRPFRMLQNVILERKLGRPLAPGMLADHANGNPLDNRRENLREATPSQNSANRMSHTTQPHGFKGIYFRKARGKWIASISVERKYTHLGSYDTPEEAARAYDQAAYSIYGEFARLNFPLQYANANYIHVVSQKPASGYRGVVLQGRRWTARLRVNDKLHSIGTFDTAIEAARAYDRYALRHRGEAAKLNFPKEDYEDE